MVVLSDGDSDTVLDGDTGPRGRRKTRRARVDGGGGGGGGGFEACRCRVDDGVTGLTDGLRAARNASDTHGLLPPILILEN